MKAIQRFAITRPIATTMFYLGLILMGTIALQDIEINLLPYLEFPRITVVTMYQNAAPEEVENLITKPIIDSVGTVSGIDKINSESLEGLSFVTIQFSWGTNIDYTSMEVREKVDLIRGILPEDATRSIITKFDPSQNPIMEVTFFPKNLSNPKDLRFFIVTEIKNYIDRIDGVAYAQFSGGHKKEIGIEIDRELLTSFELSLDEIKSSIDASNLNLPAGHITSGIYDVLIRTIGEYKNVNDIGKTIVGRNRAGVPIYLYSLANIIDGYKERTGLARFNGQECVTVSFYKEAGKNTVYVADKIKEAIDDLKVKFSKEVDINIVYDESMFVKNSINNISQSLIIGGFLAFIVLFMFLVNFKSPIILITSVVISVLTTFLLMYAQNITINMMSLGGLSLGIGMLYDSGNVVLSAINRNIKKGLSGKEAALKGAGEVTGSITSAILTTTIVFLPIIFLKGIVGVVFSDMAVTICFSLSVSWLVSLTLIPMLSSIQKEKRNSKSKRRAKIIQKISNNIAKTGKLYERPLTFFIERPSVLVSIIFLLFIFAIINISRIEREFVPKVDTGEFEIQILNTKGTSLEVTSRIVANVEKVILKFPEVKHVISQVGYDEEQILNKKGGEVGTHQAKLKIILKESRSIDTKEFIAQLRTKITLREDIEVNYIMKGDLLASLLSPDSQAITLELSGSDLSMLNYIGDNIKNTLKNIKGVVDIKTTMEEKDREYHVKFQDDKLSAFNLNHAGISSFLRTAIKGDVPTKLRVSDKEIDVRIRFQEKDRKNLEDINDFQIKISEDKNIYLTEVVNISKKMGYTSILRVGQKRINRITANIEGEKINRVYENLDRYLNNLKLPDGYEVNYGGEKENIKKSFNELIFAFVLAVILIYMMLASILESLITPLIIMGIIPLIIIGVVPALLFFNKTLNINSFTGMILLAGIVVDGGVLFYEYSKLLKEEGRMLKESIIGSGKTILPVILMNSSTTILGLLPIALELGEGTEFQSPLAVTFIGGMLLSIILSLFFLPVSFYYVNKWQMRNRAPNQ